MRSMHGRNLHLRITQAVHATLRECMNQRHTQINDACAGAAIAHVFAAMMSQAGFSKQDRMLPQLL